MSTGPPSTSKLFFFFMLAHLYGIIFQPTGQTSDGVFACVYAWASCQWACWFTVPPLHSVVCVFASLMWSIVRLKFIAFAPVGYGCMFSSVYPLSKGYWLPFFFFFYSRMLVLSTFASGTGQAFCASLPGLCFHLIILTALTLPFRAGGGWELGMGAHKGLGLCRGQVVIADVVSSKHMFSPHKVHVGPLKVW